jgi:hypothetical protein
MHPDDLDSWLVKVNTQLRTEDVPHRQRPFEAIRRYALESKSSLNVFSDTGKRMPPKVHTP